MPRILFLANPHPVDYVADGLFHGLRTLLGADVVDYPRRDALYAGEAGTHIYGKGFGLYGLLDDIEVDRDNVFERDWDLVVPAVMWREWDWWIRAWRTFGDSVRYAPVDGSDLPFMYPYGPAWVRPWRWPLPRAHTRGVYFKREWRRWSIPPRVHLEPLAISYPREKMVDAISEKTQDFQTHVVDLEVGERIGRELDHERQHIFDNEGDYLADLRSARFGVTIKRQGWDALRHYEIAGAGTVPVFRDLADKPATCSPHGLVPGRNCLAYTDADDLFAQTKALTGAAYDELVAGSLEWAYANSTAERARFFLDRALA